MFIVHTQFAKSDFCFSKGVRNGVKWALPCRTEHNGIHEIVFGIGVGVDVHDVQFFALYLNI